jgi:hypothetical protein
MYLAGRSFGGITLSPSCAAERRRASLRVRTTRYEIRVADCEREKTHILLNTCHRGARNHWEDVFSQPLIAVVRDARSRFARAGATHDIFPSCFLETNNDPLLPCMRPSQPEAVRIRNTSKLRYVLHPDRLCTCYEHARYLDVDMSFTNAPVTRALVLGLVAASVAASLFDVKHYFYILVDTQIFRYRQTWRILVYQLCYTNSSEALFASMILYNMRVVERIWGSRKYAVSPLLCKLGQAR